MRNTATAVLCDSIITSVLRANDARRPLFREISDNVWEPNRAESRKMDGAGVSMQSRFHSSGDGQLLGKTADALDLSGG